MKLTYASEKKQPFGQYKNLHTTSGGGHSPMSPSVHAPDFLCTLYFPPLHGFRLM